MDSQTADTPSDTTSLFGGLGQVSLFLAILGPFTCGASAALGLVLGASAWILCRRRGAASIDVSRARTGTLVSTAMVVVGAGLVLPVALRARDVSRSLVCHKNLVQLQLDIHMYCADYDDCYPLARTWCDVAERFGGSPALYRCPALAKVPCGYTCNERLTGRNRTALKRPEAIPLVYDGLGGWNACGGAESFVPRHRGYGNMAYADGHVKWLAPKDLPALTWKP